MRLYWKFLLSITIIFLSRSSLFSQEVLNLKEVTVTAKDSSGKNVQTANVINKIDIQLRPVNSAQDLLRLVPGLFIAQHAGGGKAEQIFLRGFDADHGTDFATFVDGIPVNMVSHAHGQGYADLHFVIPETVQQLDVYKGPEYARFGDLATSGAGEFKTFNFLPRNVIKVEGGQFNTFRGLLMINLLDQKHLFSKYKENLYVAGEYRYTNAFFDNQQHFWRFNFFSKYYGMLSQGTSLMVSASALSSAWNASGQVPERALRENLIDQFGSIDPSEGGQTSRINANVVLDHRINDHSSFKNQLFYTRYNFNLYSDFTFYLIDPVHGDEVNQADHRNMFGYKSTYARRDSLFGRPLSSEISAGVRYDNANVMLNHDEKRVFLNHIAGGILNQLNFYSYIDENYYVTPKFIINPGLRLDVFNFNFKSQVSPDSSGNVVIPRLSPKLGFIYNFNDNCQVYFRNGIGFHSNDARAVIINAVDHQNLDMVPRAYGSDLGITFKPVNAMLINIAVWTIRLQNELVYNGDDGTVGSIGRTQREGVDLAVRYELLKSLYFDFDLNYNYGRLVDAPRDSNRIPLAPSITSIAGISYKPEHGFGGSLRYRIMGNRPANESNSLTARGYYVMDATINYTTGRYQLGIAIENILNVNWREAQFDTVSRLKNEPGAVEDVNYTPGTPRFIKGIVTYYF